VFLRRPIHYGYWADNDDGSGFHSSYGNFAASLRVVDSIEELGDLLDNHVHLSELKAPATSSITEPNYTVRVRRRY
jgi:hypothetical protein